MSTIPAPSQNKACGFPASSAAMMIDMSNPPCNLPFLFWTSYVQGRRFTKGDFGLRVCTATSSVTGAAGGGALLGHILEVGIATCVSLTQSIALQFLTGSMKKLLWFNDHSCYRCFDYLHDPSAPCTRVELDEQTHRILIKCNHSCANTQRQNIVFEIWFVLSRFIVFRCLGDLLL